MAKIKCIFSQKNKAYDLVCAIIGNKNPNGSNFKRKDLKLEEKYFNIDILKALDMRLKGRAFVMVTKFRNNVEYINGVQNKLIGITGLDLDCKMLANSENTLFKEGFADYSVENYCEPPKECFELQACDAWVTVATVT